MLDPIETILEHALKHSMKKVLTELESTHVTNVPLPDSWVYMRLLQDFKENCSQGKADKEELNMVRKALVNLARQNPTLFKMVEPLDLAALVQTTSCLIVVQYHVPGSVANKKLVDAFMPEWSDQVWKKSCQVYSFKNDATHKEALGKLYDRQRSLLQDLTGSIAAEKRLRETLSASLLVQVEKVLPGVIEYLRQIRLSRLEKIRCSKETPFPSEDPIRNRLSNEEVTEEALLGLIKEFKIIKRKHLLENHRKLVSEGMVQIPLDSSPVRATFAATTRNLEAPLLTPQTDRARCIPISLTLDINGTLRNVPVNRLLPQAENGVCLSPNWFTDGAQSIKTEDGSVCANMETETEETTEDEDAKDEEEDLDALLKSLEENLNKIEDPGIQNDLHRLIGRVRAKMKKRL